MKQGKSSGAVVRTPNDTTEQSLNASSPNPWLFPKCLSKCCIAVQTLCDLGGGAGWENRISLTSDPLVTRVIFWSSQLWLSKFVIFWFIYSFVMACLFKHVLKLQFFFGVTMEIFHFLFFKIYFPLCKLDLILWILNWNSIPNMP